jgi:FkbM family methyltransferase
MREFSPLGLRARLFRRYLTLPDHPSKVRIQNLLGRALFAGGELRVAAGPVAFALDPNDWMTRHLLRQRALEPRSLALAARLVAPGGAFVDGGANFGLYTCLLAATFPSLRCVAIEPSPEMFRRLGRHLSMNGLAGVTAINAALSSRTGSATFLAPFPGNQGTGRLVDGAAADGIPVPTRRYADLAAEPRLDRVDLLKIDVEGHEMSVLEGIDFDAPARTHNILLEYEQGNLPAGTTIASYTAFFERVGYRVYTIEGQPASDGREVPESNLWITLIE